MIGVRKLSPGGYEYLTGSVACADHGLAPGESLSDYYLAHGYPPGQWFGRGAAEFGVQGEVSTAQMNALFGEGRHPDADRIQAEMIAAGHSEAEALAATKLGRRLYQFDGVDDLRSKVIDAYKQHNLDHGRPRNAPIEDETRARLRREVQAQAYAEAHEGHRPSENQLDQWLAEQKKTMKCATSGYELVLAPSKSVSLVWALGDATTREQVVNLHRQAVHDTLTYLENNVAYTRRGDGGIAQHDVRGITAAVFEHWDSRAGDPHLHTHVPISAKVQGPDGLWTALDGRTILAASVTMSEFYNSRVRDLFRDHGASWTERPAGGIDLKRPTWELDGVPNDLLVGFSRRAFQVEQDRARRIAAFRREHGREPAPKDVLEISRRAQYGTRQDKRAPRALVEHLRRWRGQAEHMLAAEVIDDLRQRVFSSPEPVSTIDVGELAETVLAVVSDHYSHFNRWNVEAEAHRQTAHLRVPAGGRDTLIGEVVHTVLHSPDTVALQSPSRVEETSELRRSTGESVFVEHNSQRYTTGRTLREESALAAWGRLTDGHRLRPDTVAAALAKTRKLNPGQRAAVAGFATSGRRVQLLYAPAGAGKTTTMRVYADAVRAEGGRVYAFGPSARAAHVLADAIDARPHTLHQVTTAQRFGVAERAFPFRRGDVLIVDEVSMAGTHTMHDVVAYALRRGADVRLVGDDKQLASVEAGGAVRWFAHLNGALRLREVVRFRDPAQRAASLQLHESNAAGLDYYFDQNWVIDGSRESIRDAAHRNWRADLDAGRQSLLIVPTNDDLTALNVEARELRLARGDVDDGVRCAQLHDGTLASRGDWVVTRHNDRLKTLFGGRDFVKNGDVWTVVGVRKDGGLKLRHHVSRGTVVVPADYVAEYIELAYAATVNRVQGMTSEGSAHGIAPQGISREQLYTLITRAVEDNRIYVETHQHTIDSHQETPVERTARGVLEHALTRSSAETSANEQLRDALIAAESLRTLVPRHDHVALLGAEHHIDTMLAEHVPTVLQAPAVPALRRTLRTAEALGWQAERLVPAALDRALPDGDDDDPAAVLQWRIQQRVLAGDPPARTADPAPGETPHWRSILEHHGIYLTGTDTWEPVWKAAAGARAEGLDTDSAIAAAARSLAERPANDPMPEHRFVLAEVDAALRRQRADGGGWQPALPWLAHPHHHRLAARPQLLDYLHRANTAIGARVDELRSLVIAEQPAWTAALGPRPLDDADAAARWDHLAGLGAAYRDTFNVTSDDPRRPLGPEPDNHSAQARAWRDLTAQWHTAPTAEPTAERAATGEPSTLDRLSENIDPDELIAALAADEMLSPDPEEEHLDDLVRRYEHSSRSATADHLDTQITAVLTDRAPAALGCDAEPALRKLLHRAHERGWPVAHAVPDTTSLTGIEDARDPAAVLYRRVEQRIQRPTAPAQPAHAGPLPWLTAPDPAALAEHPELARHLDVLAQAITDRAARLRHEVAQAPPAWTAGLGPRPQQAADAARWDQLASMAAAYRETYRVTTTHPDVPLGTQPRNDDPRLHTWTHLTDHWRPIVTTPEQFSANQARIDELRARVIDRAHDRTEDSEALAASHADDAQELHSPALAAEAAEELNRYDDVDDHRHTDDLGSGFIY